MTLTRYQVVFRKTGRTAIGRIFTVPGEEAAKARASAYAAALGDGWTWTTITAIEDEEAA